MGKELLEKAQKGDIKAFHELFSEFQSQLKSYLYRLIANRNDVEDLTHDTFVQVFDKITSFKGKSSLKTWTFTIASNLAMDLLRKRKRWPTDAQDQCRAVSLASAEMQKQQRDVHQHSPHGDFEIREHIDFCFTCISKTLPLTEQVALMLKDVYSFKVKEIAEIINKSEAKVKHLIRDARQKMVEVFDARCALINKTGACHQCSELNGIFNPKQNIQEELVKLELVKQAESGGWRWATKVTNSTCRGNRSVKCRRNGFTRFVHAAFTGSDRGR